MFYAYILIVMVIRCEALDVPIKIKDAVTQFYADHHLPALNVARVLL